MKSMRFAGVEILFVLLSGACGGGSTSPPAPTPITVNGRVRERQEFSELRLPAVGVSVVIEGHPQVVTDGAGVFHVDDVVPPYTVIVLDDGNAGAVVYAGLTRSDPVLLGPLPTATALQGAAVEGDVTGGVGWPTPPGTETIVAYGSAGRGSMAVTTADATGGAYDVSLQWVGASPIEVTGAAIQMETDGDGVPLSYTGFGTSRIDANNGWVHTAVDIALAPVSTGLVSGTVAIPTGYSDGATLLEAKHFRGPSFLFWMGLYPPGPFSAPVPDPSDTILRLLLSSTAPTGEDVYLSRVVQPGDSGLAFQIPGVTRQLGPSDGTAGVTHATTFQVNRQSGRAYNVRYYPVAPADGPYVFLTTAASSWTLPDLSAYGVTLPAATTYEWTVEGLGSATVNDLCDDLPFKSRASFYSTSSGWIEFTTAP